MLHHTLHRSISIRYRHIALVTTLACSLSLSLTPALLAQSPAANLLTPISSWQSPEDLKSTVAVEGLRVEMHSKVLTGGAPHFSFQAFNGKVYQADLEELKWNDLGATTWVGKIAEFGEHSEVLLSTFDGAVAGLIDTPDGRSEIDPTPDGHVLIKVDSSRFDGCGTKDPDHRHPVPAADIERAAETVGLKPEAVTTAGADKSTANIDISVLFTEKVVDNYGSQSKAISKATAAIEILDTAFSKSEINANANFVGYGFLTEEQLGDTSGSGDGAVNTIYSSGNQLGTSGRQDWYQNRHDLEGISKSNDLFGYALAVGHFNHDDYQDLAIGIPEKDIDGHNNTGAVMILYGTPDGLSSANADYFHQDTSGVKGGNQSGDRFGFSLAAGDFDGDGYDDLAIGKPYEDYNSKSNTGAVNILYGSPDGITVSGDQVIYQSDLGQSEGNDDQFGYSLTAGDFDGDGADDLAISANKKDHSGKTAPGQVTVIYGSGGGLDTSHFAAFRQGNSGVSDSPENNDRFGETLASGNFDGDAYDDLVVGVPNEDSSGDNSGMIHVLFGSGSGLTGIGSQAFNQSHLGDDREPDDRFGFALAVGDFNGDTKSDLAASAPWEGGDNKGRVHFLFGSSSGLTASSLALSGASSDKLGYSLAASNFDGDDDHDLAIGRPGYDGGGENSSGAVSTYHSIPGLPPILMKTWTQDNSSTFNESEKDDWFGEVLAAGDFDGNGKGDLAIGTPEEGVSDDSDFFKDWLGDSGMAAASRNTHSADLVGMLVENVNGHCGSAQKVLGDTDGDSDIFYQVTKRSCSVGHLTFAHEFGHLIGLAHDPGQCRNLRSL